MILNLAFVHTLLRMVFLLSPNGNKFLFTFWFTNLALRHRLNVLTKISALAYILFLWFLLLTNIGDVTLLTTFQTLYCLPPCWFCNRPLKSTILSHVSNLSTVEAFLFFIVEYTLTFLLNILSIKVDKVLLNCF